MFKIRNKETGLFSSGGGHPKFSNRGKVWNMRGHVSSHLTQLSESEKKYFYSRCEVVEYEMVEVGPVNDVLDWELLPATVRAKELEEDRRNQRQKEYHQEKIRRLEQELQQMKAKKNA